MAKAPMLEQILEISPFACVLVGDDYQIKYMNPIMSAFMVESLAFSSDKELTGSSILTLIPEQEHEDFISFLQAVGEPGKEQLWETFRFLDEKGASKEFLLSGSKNFEQFSLPGFVLLSGLPLSENRITEIFSNNSHQYGLDSSQNTKYKKIFEGAVVGIAILDEKMQIEEMNQTFTNHLGLAKENILAQPYSQAFTEDAKEKIINLNQRVSKGTQIHAKDVVTINHHDGDHRILEISLSEMADGNLNPIRYMLITEDITHQKDTHAALLQSEKLALTGRLAASLAHEINNPLQTSIGCLGLVEEMLDEDDKDLRVYITMAMEELERGARIVKKLRDLNRKTSASDITPVDLQAILEDVLLLTKNRFYDQDIVPIFPYQGPPPVVMASEDQIRQVFLNLIMNATDAIPSGGNIYIDIIHTDAPRGIEVKIRDTGVGIDQEVMNHIFDPFFSTKKDGLGLGLYICKQIIDDHNGSLSVESESGIGTEFTIWLPKLEFSAEKEQ